MSQAQLASLVGVSPATVSKWRSGNQAPEGETLERLAGVVNVTPEGIFRPGWAARRDVEQHSSSFRPVPEPHALHECTTLNEKR
ncbi:helix-turn-helix transcriptional regulator [Ampullimonas aquatilis]|uniref:helix-turn-helix transcriptional regulator n=1 Tax=Ampullimonas aquatilis TaxID=1341549 RepID=UPI003C78FAA8